MVRTMLSEIMHTVNPWRHIAAGNQLLANPGWDMGMAGVGLAGARDDNDREDVFGPLWFAVPKKRVRLVRT